MQSWNCALKTRPWHEPDALTEHGGLHAVWEKYYSKMKPLHAHVTVLYASQTGTAADVAYGLAREVSRRMNRLVTARSVGDYDVTRLSREQRLIIVCSTTGKGQEPDSMRALWRYLLNKRHPSNMLNGVQVAIFGLGDSSYAEYNFVAKKLYRRLMQLGATSLVPLGLGNESHELGYSGTLKTWLADLWVSMRLQHEAVLLSQLISPHNIICDGNLDSLCGVTA